MKTFNIHFQQSVSLILGGFFCHPIGNISGNVQVPLDYYFYFAT